MSQAPSDWQRGVLDAAKWVEQHVGSVPASKLRDSLSKMDHEGTEARVVRQILQYVRERESLLDCPSNISDDIEFGDWKQE